MNVPDPKLPLVGIPVEPTAPATNEAAYHLGKSLESFSARLRDSRAVGVANAVVLATSPDRLREAHTRVKQSSQAALDGDAPERAKAGLELASTGWQLAYVYQTLGKAAHTVTRIGLDRMGRVAALAPAAAGAQNAIARLALTPIGKAAAAFSKWVPMLNIVGVAVSAKTAIDVKRDARSSGATLALAGGSLALAGAGLWAAVALGFWPFLGLTAVGIGVDVALMKSWQRDRARAAAAPVAETAGSREIVAAE